MYFYPKKSLIITILMVLALPDAVALADVLRWNWDALNTDQIHFPANFLLGVGTSAYQVEGNCTNTDWYDWEHAQDELGNPRVQEPSGIACDHWNRYKEDIQLIKALGVNTYRFSIDWGKVEPEEGIFDETALEHYKAVCEELVRNDIKPCITLFHYALPRWFSHLGGFESAENSAYFVRFATKVFERLHPYVHLWFTFNSPCSSASKSYLLGERPPGVKNMQRMAEVYKNILQTHVRTYQALKTLPGGKEARIGIIKNIYQLDPWNSWNPADLLACSMAKSLIDDPYYSFFTTGRFKIHIPFKAYVVHENIDAPQSLDFIGLNYYGHGYMKNFARLTPPDEIRTDNPNYTLYPEGLYRAVQELSEKIARPLGIPIYITENGIATQEATIREQFLRTYLYALSQTIADGYPVRGYIHWSLMDNYEWGTYAIRYGLYHVDFTTQERYLKPGSHVLREIIGKTGA